jgi:hypothetical protein
MKCALRRPYVKGDTYIIIFFHGTNAIPRKNSRLPSNPMGASTDLKRGKEGLCRDVSTLLWKWIAASSSEKGNKNYHLSAKIISYGPESFRMEMSPATPLFFLTTSV